MRDFTPTQLRESNSQRCFGSLSRAQRLAELGEAADIESLNSHLLYFANDLGFGLFGAIAWNCPPGGLRQFSMTHNAPADFAEFTVAPEDAKRDPVNAILKKVTLPFVYDQSTYLEAGSADLWEHQACHGYNNGIVAITFLPGGQRFALGFDRHDPVAKDDISLVALLAHLQLIAVHTQSAALRLLFPAKSNLIRGLTQRELEVLKLAAIRKTAKQTAGVLTITERTVAFHMRHVCEKLDVANKHQAIEAAKHLGLI